MLKQLKPYLLIASALGLSYAAYNRFTSVPPLSLQVTKKVLQQIKHQMLIVTVNFSEGISKHIQGAGSMKGKDDIEKVKTYFKTQILKLYQQKQELILSKYSISKERFGQSLKRYKNDKLIRHNQQQIMDMMDKAIQGQTPDLTVPEIAKTSFGKQEIKNIYLQMCKLVATKVIIKLQEQKIDNPDFDPADNQAFRKTIRKLSIYNMKVDYLKTKRFKEQWGCPNEIFFKISEYHKLTDPIYKTSMVKIEKAYQKIIEIVSKDPEGVQTSEIDDFFSEKKPEEVIRISKSMNAESFEQQQPEQNIKLSKSYSDHNRKQEQVEKPQEQSQIIASQASNIIKNQIQPKIQQLQQKIAEKQQQANPAVQLNSVQQSEIKQPINAENKESQQVHAQLQHQKIAEEIDNKNVQEKQQQVQNQKDAEDQQAIQKDVEASENQEVSNQQTQAKKQPDNQEQIAQVQKNDNQDKVEVVQQNITDSKEADQNINQQSDEIADQNANQKADENIENKQPEVQQ